MRAPAPDHYENFPVASILMPARLRHATRVIYWFARSADDIADEGNAPAEQRLAALEDYREQLRRIERNETPHGELFTALAEVIARHRLPMQPFHDLLDAFTQDVSKQRYETFAEVMEYCKKSANPIGRLMLALYGEHDERNIARADAICSALQWINFLQDIAIDYDKQRIYMPQADLRRYHISERQIARRDSGGMWTAFMLAQIERGRKLLQAGAPLGKALKGRAGLEMRMIIAGGALILEQLHRSHGDIFSQRPKLQPRDWLIMVYRAIRAR